MRNVTPILLVPLTLLSFAAPAVRLEDGAAGGVWK